MSAKPMVGPEPSSDVMRVSGTSVLENLIEVEVAVLAKPGLCRPPVLCAAGRVCGGKGDCGRDSTVSAGAGDSSGAEDVSPRALLALPVSSGFSLAAGAFLEDCSGVLGSVSTFDPIVPYEDCRLTTYGVFCRCRSGRPD